MTNRNQYQGMVLLVVLGVLALMSVLAITFVQMTRLERGIARNYVDRTRAVLTAESGVEYAFAKITNFQGGVLANAEYEDMKYDPDPDNSDMAFARKASFQDAGFAKAGSGVTGSTYQDRGDYFILRVEDESGKLNLNDTDGSWNMDDDADPDPDTDDDKLDAPHRLRMLVQTLGETLFPDDPGKGALISLALFNARSQLPGSRFTDMRQLSDILVDPPAPQTPVLTKAEFQTFAGHVTLWSWQDENVIRPTYSMELSLPSGRNIPGPGDEYGVSDGGGGSGFHYQDVLDGYDSIHCYLFYDMQTKYFELEPRCPVNINTSSLELIRALITPLSGWYLEEGPAAGVLTNGQGYGTWMWIKAYYWYKAESHTGSWNHTYGNQLMYGRTRQVIMEAAIAEELGVALYERIHGKDINMDGYPAPGAQAGPFETWQEFIGFIHDKIDDPLQPGADPMAGFSKYMADLVIANFNPNSQLNDYNPDAHIFRYVDKSQLVRYSTEFCFEPTGYFNIHSLGLITKPDASVAASYKIDCVTRLFQMYRQTTQAQFMRGYTGPDDLGRFFDGSQSFTTAGVEPGIAGYTLQSYPEPIVDDQSVPYTEAVEDRNYLDDSHFDGYLMPAVWRGLKCQQGTDTYIINFERTFKPDTDPHAMPPEPQALPWGQPPDPPYGFLFNYYEDQTGGSDLYKSNLPTLNRLTHSRDNGAVPGILYPDGAFSEHLRCPGFDATDIGEDTNTLGMIGSVNFWIKPNFDVGRSNRIRQFFRMGQDSWQMHFGACLHLFYFPHQPNPPNAENSITTDLYYKQNTMPPCTLVFGWNTGMIDTKLNIVTYNGAARGSTTVTHDWHAAGYPGHGIEPLYNVDSHQWSQMAFSWNMFGEEGATGEGMSDFAVNGQTVDDTVADAHIGGDSWDPPWQGNKIPVLHWWTTQYWLIESCKKWQNYARLGGDVNWNGYGYPADSTYADVFAHRIQLDSVPIASFFQAGRYYNYTDPANYGQLACYTAPEINLQKELHLFKERLELRSVSWTLYWPMTNRDAGNSDFYIDTQGVDVNSLYPDDPVIPDGWDPILVDVAVNDYWFYDNDKSQMPTYAGGSRPKYADGSLMRINLGRGDQFSFRVYFHMGGNTALYNAPVLDDITFTFAYTSPKILIWNVL
ncbi:PilX N-terminal domain-containing pilus assembly protein [Planctomycetota bacterium]